MAIEVIPFEEKERWDNIVKSFKQYEVYQLNGYVEGFRVHGDGIPLLFYLQDGENRALNIVMKRDVAECNNLKDKVNSGEYFDLITPYGYGGIIVDGEMTPNMKEEYNNYCKDNNYVCEFVRFNPMQNNAILLKDFYETIFLGNTISIDLDSEDYVWSNFTSKNRNMIRKAIKEGVVIKHTTEDWIIDDFQRIYAQTMQRDDADSYYYFAKEYYDTFFDELKDNNEFFYAEKDGEIIACSIMMFANENMHYHLSASTMEGRRLAASNLLLWEAAQYGVSHGLKGLHLGGGVGAKEDSLYSFKKAFNKSSHREYYIGKKIYNEEKYAEFVEKSNVDDSVGFFPKYRG